MAAMAGGRQPCQQLRGADTCPVGGGIGEPGRDEEDVRRARPQPAAPARTGSSASAAGPAGGQVFWVSLPAKSRVRGGTLVLGRGPLWVRGWERGGEGARGKSR